MKMRVGRNYKIDAREIYATRMDIKCVLFFKKRKTKNKKRKNILLLLLLLLLYLFSHPTALNDFVFLFFSFTPGSLRINLSKPLPQKTSQGPRQILQMMNNQVIRKRKRIQVPVNDRHTIWTEPRFF